MIEQCLCVNEAEYSACHKRTNVLQLHESIISRQTISRARYAVQYTEIITML